MAGVDKDYLEKSKKFKEYVKKLNAAFAVLSVVVFVVVFWWLKLVGITVTSENVCIVNEHIHSEECYASELICGETEYAEETDSTQTSAESHVHTSECYETYLSCSTAEHMHTIECYSDQMADVESVSEWIGSFADAELSDNIPENLASIALSQVGYEESHDNFAYDDEGNKNGYTRYGDWYGHPYGNWNAMFVSFCLHYATMSNTEAPKGSGAESLRINWQNSYVYAAADQYTPQRGDVVFTDSNGDASPDGVGIIISADEEGLVIVKGDSNNKVETLSIGSSDSIVGYGVTSKLTLAEKVEEEATESETYEEEANSEETPNEEMADEEINGEETADDGALSDEIINDEIADVPPIMLFGTGNSNITYTSYLEGEVINAEFKTQTGEVIGDGSTVYIGQNYVVSLEFSEINTGTQWIQFRHDENGYLTYHIPSNLQCEPFTSWHKISAQTENGTIQDVGEYFVDENGLLKVKFYEIDGVNFVEKYTNVDFTIDFNATVASTQSGSTTEVVFNDEIRIDLNVDGGADMTFEKTQLDYDIANNTVDFKIVVKATKGVIKDLVIDDIIWHKQFTLRDTILVTDLEGNVIDPQPTVSNSPEYNNGDEEGFRLTGFPDFSAGNGYIITYKTQIYDDLLSGESVYLWNDAYAKGSSANGTEINKYTYGEGSIEFKKFVKEGKQVTVDTSDGGKIDLIEWVVRLNKAGADFNGTVIIDTLGEGLEYYQDIPIKVRGVNENGVTRTVEIPWTDVTINGNSMSFELPLENDYKITYYTSFEPLDAGETEKNYTNSAKVTINGEELETNGTGQVVGFSPEIKKTAWGQDGKYVYFNIETNAAAMLKDKGYFYLTDLCAFWNYPEYGQTLYVENLPEDLVITATLESGEVITFTPYVSGSADDTYILEAPVLTNNGEAEYHTFRIYFNTSRTHYSDSSWIYDENAIINISYKLPFDSRTGSNWTGVPNGDKTLGDVLLEKEKLANEAYYNYMQGSSITGAANYEYTPAITKQSVVNEDGTIDYTVVFNNTVPGSGGDQGYLTLAQQINFTDTFDEKLEYVEGSLMVTCYDPWRDGLWLNKYKYNGTVEGNSMNISATDFLFYEYNYAGAQYNPDGSELWGTWLTYQDNYLKYCNAMRGGEHIFTYKLKIKDEYMSTTEHSKFILDNTAELTWDNDGSSGPVTESSEYETGLIDKHVVQENNTLDFDIHINRRALDILEGSETLTIEDTMTSNLSVYWDSIKLLYEDKNGNWIDFDSAGSAYSYTVTYDQANNKLTFVVPDELHIRVDYTTLITQSGLVSVNNAVKIDGKAQVSDIIDAIFKVEEYSGGASGSIHNMTLLKQDGDTDMPLPGVTFLLYGPVGDPDATVPDGADATIIAENGQTIQYIGSYTTGNDGSVLVETQYLTLGGPYAFVETAPPSGYRILEKPVNFFFYSPDPNGAVQTITTILAIENFMYSYVLPETGGPGSLYLTVSGFALTVLPVMCVMLCSKRKKKYN